MDHSFLFVTETLLEAEDFEQLTRPFLAMLTSATGMESVFLATSGADLNEFKISYARTDGQLILKEGANFPWPDLLNKKTTSIGEISTDNCGISWKEDFSGQNLHAQSYFCSPIRTKEGVFLGALCGASLSLRELSSDSLLLIKFISKLIEIYLERDGLISTKLRLSP